MRVLVTGGAGFIGANLCRGLTARGIDRVVALDDLSTGRAENLAGTGADLVEASILDEGVLARLVRDADAVVHLAARPSVPRSLADPVASHTVNATGTVCVLEACRRESVHVVAASSSSVYGAVPDLPKHEELPARPLSPYGASKLATEAYVLAYRFSFGLPALAFRFFNVYGPLQPAGHAYAAVIPAFIDAALRGEPLLVHGDGGATRDFTYVGTVTGVLADAVDGCEALVISGGHVASLFNRLALFDVLGLIGNKPVIGWSAGAMVLTERIVIFHDYPPYGSDIAQVLDAGFGIASGVVALPDPKRRVNYEARAGIQRYNTPDRLG